MGKHLKVAAQIIIYFVLFSALLAPFTLYWFRFLEQRTPAVPASPMTQAPIEAVSIAAALIAALLLGMAFKSVRIRNFGLGSSRGVAHLASGTAIGGLLILLVLAIIRALGAASLNPEYSLSFSAMTAAMIVSLSINAMVQEVIFRGYFLTALRANYSATIAIVVSSLIFAAAHAGALAEEWPISGIGGVNLFLAGVLMSIAYLRTKSLWLPTGIHIGWNASQALLNLSVTGADFLGRTPVVNLTGAPIITGGALGLEGSAPGLTGPIAGIAIVLLLFRTKGAHDGIDPVTAGTRG